MILVHLYGGTEGTRTTSTLKPTKIVPATGTTWVTDRLIDRRPPNALPINSVAGVMLEMASIISVKGANAFEVSHLNDVILLAYASNTGGVESSTILTVEVTVIV